MLNIFAISVAQIIWDEVDRLWSKNFLRKICGYLDLDEMSFSAVEPLMEAREDKRVLSSSAFLSSFSEDRSKLCCERFVYGVVNILIQSERGYDSRIRQSILVFCVETNISREFLYRTETQVSQLLQSSVDVLTTEEVVKGKTKTSSSLWKNMAVGAGAVAGGTALILTGGLAAPALASCAAMQRRLAAAREARGSKGAARG